MSIKNPPGGFSFIFGSSLTVVTTAAAGGHHGKTGIFTGVVLDETKLNFKRGSKLLTVSVSGDYWEDECDHEVQNNTDKDFDDPQTEQDKADHALWQKDQAEAEKHWNSEQEIQCESWHMSDHDKHDKHNKHNKHDKHDFCDKPHQEKKDHKKCDLRPKENFLVLALTRPSHPYKTGEVVWINIDQIVSVAVGCKN